MKIAILCHFSNPVVRKRLVLFEKSSSKTGHKKAIYPDFAPWITDLLDRISSYPEHEIHVISPHRGMRKIIQEFEIDGVRYHFYNSDIFKRFNQVMTRLFPNSMNHYLLSRCIIRRFFERINPEIINLVGAENPYYSVGALDVQDIPILLTAQTVYSNPNRKKLSGSFVPFRAALERQIYGKIKYVRCTGRMYYDLIKEMNPSIHVFKMGFSGIKIPHVEDQKIEFDFVNFAGNMGDSKGGLDALEALLCLRKRGTVVSLNVVGKSTSEYRAKMEAFVSENDLCDQVTFSGYFKEHVDMFKQVKKSRFALLPIKLDVISGTIVEAINLGLPVVTYRTSGTPYLNKDGETVLISKIGDVKALADNMRRLIDDPNLGGKLSRAARAFVDKELQEGDTTKRLVDNLLAILEYERNGTPIPEEMLFNPDDYPDYEGVYDV